MIIVIPFIDNRGTIDRIPSPNGGFVVRPKRGFPSPIIIIDYTRSDEVYTLNEIKNYAQQFASDLITTGIIAGLSEPTIYSLDYSMTFTHEGIAYGNSLKTKFHVSISNAPTDLVTLLKIQQYVSQQNLELFTQAISKVIDSQVAFPTGGFVVKDIQGNIVTRKFTIYSTPFNADPRRINSTLELYGASFDDLVMRLGLSFNLDKEQLLITQLKDKIEPLGYTVNFSSNAGENLELIKPAISKYYAPSPLVDLLSQICLDNNLIFKIFNTTIAFFKLGIGNEPPQDIESFFSFNSTIPDTLLIANFILTNYASCQFESELFDPDLFETIAVYDDSGLEGLFANLTAIPNQIFRNRDNKNVLPYRLYIQSYTISDSRDKTTVNIIATNNWLLTSNKIDALFENKVYTNALK